MKIKVGYTIRSFFFLFFVFLSWNRVYCSAAASEVDIFANAFKGNTPFYAVTVARDTMTEAYGPLTPLENEVVFSFLTFLLSGDHGRFVAVSRRLITEKEQWFTEKKVALEKTTGRLNPTQITNLIVDEAVDTFAKVSGLRDFLGFGGSESTKKEVFKAKLKTFILSSVHHYRTDNTLDEFRIHLREAFEVPSKTSTAVFDTKSQEIFNVIVTHNERFEKRKHDEAEKVIFNDVAPERIAFDRYNSKIGRRDPQEFFRGILANIERICAVSQRIHREQIQTNRCLVVFNEMFFSKDVPLSSDEFIAIERQLRDLTQRHKNVLFHANFLYGYTKAFTNEAEYKTFMDEQARRVGVFSTRTGKQVFESSRYTGYAAYAAQFSAYKPSLNIIRNQSIVFWNGSPVTTYLKSSYRTEADRFLEGRLYELGTAEDEIIATGSSQEAAIATLLRSSSLSTAICYDLEIGVRNAMATYPSAGKVHIVVSNTLSLVQAGRAANLPEHIPLIIHVDPKDQEILLRNEVKAILLPDTTPATTGDPLHADPFNQFTKAMPIATFRLNLTDNNVFIFHIWDLRHCLEIAALQQTAAVS